MTILRDPPRLSSPGSSASKAARALLDASRTELPDAVQLARLAQRIPGVGAGGPAPRSPSAPALAPAPVAPATSVVGGALTGAALALAVVCGVWQRDASRPSSVVPPRPVPAAPRASPPEPPAPLPLPPAARPVSREGDGSPEPPPSPAPAVVAIGGAPPARAVASGDRARASLLGGSPAEGGGPPPGDTETEIELLGRAQRALPGQPAAALAAVEDHRRRFPGGALAQERDVIAISALIALGRRGEAEGLAEHFAASYPRSPHRAGIDALLHGPAAGRLDQKGARERARTP